MKVFAGDIAKIRRIVRDDRTQLKKQIEQFQNVLEREMGHMRPEQAKTLSHFWYELTHVVTDVCDDHKEIFELCKSIEKKNEIQYPIDEAQ